MCEKQWAMLYYAINTKVILVGQPRIVGPYTLAAFKPPFDFLGLLFFLEGIGATLRFSFELAANLHPLDQWGVRVYLNGGLRSIRGPHEAQRRHYQNPSQQHDRD